MGNEWKIPFRPSYRDQVFHLKQWCLSSLFEDAAVKRWERCSDFGDCSVQDPARWQATKPIRTCYGSGEFQGKSTLLQQKPDRSLIEEGCCQLSRKNLGFFFKWEEVMKLQKERDITHTEWRMDKGHLWGHLGNNWHQICFVWRNVCHYRMMRQSKSQLYRKEKKKGTIQ